MSKEYEVVVIGDIESPDDCLRGLVQVACDSIAKQISIALTCISEKYGHSREELSLLLREDPRFADALKEHLEFKPITEKDNSKVAEEPKLEKSTLKTKKGKKVIIKKPEETK